MSVFYGQIQNKNHLSIPDFFMKRIFFKERITYALNKNHEMPMQNFKIQIMRMKFRMNIQIVSCT